MGIARASFLGIIASLALISCSTIQLVSPYDAPIDQGAIKLQQETARFFVDLDAATSTSERSFASHQEFYKQASAELATLMARAALLPKNDVIAGQLMLVRRNLAEVALWQKGCLTKAPGEDQIKAIDAQGIDASPVCQTAWGAEADATGREGSSLNPKVIADLKSELDQQFSAVESFEMRLQRGEKEAGK